MIRPCTLAKPSFLDYSNLWYLEICNRLVTHGGMLGRLVLALLFALALLQELIYESCTLDDMCSCAY